MGSCLAVQIPERLLGRAGVCVCGSACRINLKCQEEKPGQEAEAGGPDGQSLLRRAEQLTQPCTHPGGFKEALWQRWEGLSCSPSILAAAAGHKETRECRRAQIL